MMSYPRFCSSCVLSFALAVAACATSPDGSQGSEGAQVPSDANDGESYRHPAPRPHLDAGTPPKPDVGTPPKLDAGTPPKLDAGGSDAGIASGGGGGGIAVGGVVSCYADYAPTATCAVPTTHCCFSNYSVQHAGSCEASSCSWGTIDCDGPEDCAGGQHCCANVIIDPSEGIMGYKAACQASACGAAPAHVELCHPGASAVATCGSGKTCVSAATADHDLPRSLSICQ